MSLIPQEVFDAYNTVVDGFVADLGVRCRLFYPAIHTSCANCVYDTLNNRSSNQYNGTGPIPFTFGVCPFCNGLGFFETPQTDIIQLRVYFSKKGIKISSFASVSPLINIPAGGILTLGVLSDLPKIKRSEQMQTNIDQEGYGVMLYNLHGEPVPYGFKNNRYLASIWQRA